MSDAPPEIPLTIMPPPLPLSRMTFSPARCGSILRSHARSSCQERSKRALLTFLWVPFMIVRVVVGRGRRG
jgi:hypothetical protein